MMIKYEEGLKDRWEWKIVFAPNGFGKTQASLSLEADLAKDQARVGLFTRSKIEDLVQGFNESLYMGVGAKTIVQKKIKEQQIADSSPLKPIASQFYKTSTPAKTREKSFYYAYHNITAFKAIPKFSTSRLARETVFDLSNNLLLHKFDSFLSLETYNEIEKLITNIKNPRNKNPRPSQSQMNNELPSDYLECLLHLYFYSKLNNLSRCVLCGHTYKGHQALIKEIDAQILRLKLSETDTIEKTVFRCAEKILSSVRLTGDSELSSFFPDQSPMSFSKAYKLILLYRQLGQEILTAMEQTIASSPVKGTDETIFDVQKEIDNCDSQISTIRKKPDTIRRFNKFIEREVRSLIHFSDDVEVSGLSSECGLSFKLNGKEIKNPCQVFSESEIKRISLIVLRAEIKYSHLNAVILDDPVDSYDDYNKDVAINYISKILKMSAVKRWYVTTNDFHALLLLSQAMHASAIFYLDGIDYVNGAPRSLLMQECTSRQVEQIARNEIAVLSDFVNLKQSNFPYDKDIMLCALSLTLRNIKTEVIKKYSNLYIKEKTKPVLPPGPSWIDDVKQRLEACAEHYTPAGPLSTLCSSSLTVGQVANCFSRLNNSETSAPAVFEKNFSSFETFRDTAARSNLPLHGDYTDIVDYLYKKILLVNAIKYSFERKIIQYLFPVFSSSDFQLVISKNSGLYSRISEGIRLARTNYPSILRKLLEAEKIHERFSPLYNSFDHALTALVTPYLSTSVDDLKNFNDAVKTF